MKVQILSAARAVWPPAVLPVSIAQAPLALAVVLKVRVNKPSVLLAVRLTVALASAVPTRVGAVLLLAATGAVITGAAALVSMVRVSAAEVVFAVTSLAVMVLTVPAALPSKEVVGVKVHTPVLALAVVLPRKKAPLYTSTVPPLVTATPVRTGVVLLVLLSPWSPLSLLFCSRGVDGLAASMVNVLALLLALELPAMSICVAVMLCAPVSRLLANDQAPELLALTRPNSVGTELTVFVITTVAPFSAPVPLMTGWAPGEVRAVTLGAEAAMSTVTLRAALAAPSLPALSLCLTVMLWVAAVSARVGLMTQTPWASAVAVPIEVVLALYKVTLAPGLALPLKVGVVTLVMLSPARPLSLVRPLVASGTKAGALGAPGATVSMVIVRVALDVLKFDACVAVINRPWLLPANVVR